MKMLQHITTGELYIKDDATQLFPRDLTGTCDAVAWHLSDDTVELVDDMEEVTVFRIGMQTILEEDKGEAEAILTAMFWDTFNRADFGDDIPMKRETFNNWTDALCKDGTICDDAYDQLCMIED